MTIGKYTYGNPSIIGDGNVSIGKYCSIGDNVRIITWGHHIDWISTYPFPVPLNNNWTEIARENGHPIKKDIIIGNDVWIGDSAIISYGVTIGDGAVISAGSFVTRNVKPYSVVGGNPAERLFFRFEKEFIDLLLELKWWDLPDEEIKELIPILCSKNFDLLKEYKTNFKK